MTKLTWLGDEDPSVQTVTVFGQTFVKGEAADVKGKTALEKLKGNPMFSSDGSAKPVASTEPEPVDPEAGTEKAALKNELRSRGEDVKGNPSVETLRSRLAALAAKD